MYLHLTNVASRTLDEVSDVHTLDYGGMALLFSCRAFSILQSRKQRRQSNATAFPNPVQHGVEVLQHGAFIVWVASSAGSDSGLPHTAEAIPKSESAVTVEQFSRQWANFTKNLSTRPRIISDFWRTVQYCSLECKARRVLHGFECCNKQQSLQRTPPTTATSSGRFWMREEAQFPNCFDRTTIYTYLWELIKLRIHRGLLLWV